MGNLKSLIGNKVVYFWLKLICFLEFFYLILIVLIPIHCLAEMTEISKLSLETLTEVAASVTKRTDSSPEYDEVAKTSREINMPLPIRPPTTVLFIHS